MEYTNIINNQGVVFSLVPIVTFVSMAITIWAMFLYTTAKSGYRLNKDVIRCKLVSNIILLSVQLLLMVWLLLCFGLIMLPEAKSLDAYIEGVFTTVRTSLGVKIDNRNIWTWRPTVNYTYTCGDDVVNGFDDYGWDNPCSIAPKEWLNEYPSSGESVTVYCNPSVTGSHAFTFDQSLSITALATVITPSVLLVLCIMFNFLTVFMFCWRIDCGLLYNTNAPRCSCKKPPSASKRTHKVRDIEMTEQGSSLNHV